jgi:uncharacterized protein with HEPN domain
MPRDVSVILDEIVGAIYGTERAIKRQGLEALDEDWLLQRGVERGMKIISEAVRHVPGELLASRPDMPWAEIRGIGNRIRHEYHRVSPRIIKAVVTDDLPALKVAILSLEPTPN